jgi:dihydrofolate reductase
METVVSIIAAVSDNGVIGLDNDLPWHVPADLRRFKRLTTGHHMIMGRRTWESIGCRPLPGRPTIVMTRDEDYRVERARVAHSLAEALELVASDEDEVFIAGGEAIYRMALPVSHRIYLTRIHAEFDGDTRFPEFDADQWRVVAEERFEPDEKNRYPYSFLLYERTPHPLNA